MEKNRPPDSRTPVLDIVGDLVALAPLREGLLRRIDRTLGAG